MGYRSVSRLMLAVLMLSLALFIPGSTGQALGADDSLSMTPVADAWVNKAKPGANYGSATLLRAQKGASHSYLRFNLSPWLGLPITSLRLELAGLSGDASRLAVQRTGTGWKEGGLTWKNRPSIFQAGGAVNLTAGTARFGLKGLFPSGVVDRQLLSLRVTNASGALVRFGSRESASKPRLVLNVGPRLAAVGLPPLADTFANKAKPKRNFGSVKALRVSTSPVRQSYLSFDLSAWNGHAVDKLELQLRLADGAGKGIRVYRVGTGWKEGTLTWNKRPTGGTLLTTTTKAVSAGWLKLDVTSAFAGKVVNSNRLGLRIMTTHADGFAASSRQGAAPPVLRVMPATSATESTPSPSPSTSPTPSPSPTPKPSASPSPSPTASPTPSPSPTPSATPSASPSPTPEPQFHFRGGGNAHGVGMSQNGAFGRAKDGQSYTEILGHYFTNTSIGVQEPATVVRVLLATDYVPTEAAPARVVALDGSWFSDVFPESLVQPFPAGSSAVMARDLEGTWTASVYGPNGLLMASVATSDLLMQPTDELTLFYMKFRDSLKKHDTYRGQMRLRVTGTNSLHAVNIVSMDDYLKGVVPNEVPASWPKAAVRAQAIAARSFVSFRLRTTNIWDVKPDKSHQVYGGVKTEHPAATGAVLHTSGKIVLRANGKVAEALFHAVAGGHTENNEYAFLSGGEPGTPVAYLRGKPDLDSDGVPYEIKYNASLSAFAWATGKFTMQQLSDILAKDSRTNVGLLTSMDFERGVSGRAWKVTVTGSKGSKSVTGGAFTNIYNANKLSGGNLRSTMFYLEPAP